MTEERKPKKEGISGGIRQGLGVLSAFKEAIEETISEARERGDLSTERAKEIMKGALDKAQEAAGEARERLESVTQEDFDGVKEVVGDLKDRVQKLEQRIRKGFGQEETAPEEGDPEAEGDVAAEEQGGGDDRNP